MMKSNASNMFCLIIFCTLVSLIHTFDNDSYTAVVFEYQTPSSSDNATETMEKNLDYYRENLDTVVGDIDIVVLPEYGLTGFQKEPKNYTIQIPDSLPANYPSILGELSKIAKNKQCFVVANMLELSECKCYSTTVVFDRHGVILARYRKINLDNEPKLTPGNKAITFKTDFGTFGLQSSSDIIHDFPSQSILEDNNVTNVILTSAFKSQTPFGMSLSLQSGYALANGINVLAASWSNPSEGYGGSGIYSGNQIKELYISGSKSTKLLTQRVPIISSRKASCNNLQQSGTLEIQRTLNHESRDITGYKTESIVNKDLETKPLLLNRNSPNSEQSTESRICIGSMCCEVHVSVLSYDIESSIEYRLVAKTGKESTCALLACEKGKGPENCGTRSADVDHMVFNKISIETNTKEKLKFRPVSLLSSLEPIPNLSYCSNNNNNYRLIHEGKLPGVIAFGMQNIITNSAMLPRFFLLNLLFTGIIILKYFTD